MGHVHDGGEWLRRGRLVGALGCCLLTGCALVSRDWYGSATGDAGAEAEAGFDDPGPVTELSGDGIRPHAATDRPDFGGDGGPPNPSDAGRDLDTGPGSASAQDAATTSDGGPPPGNSGKPATPDPVKGDAGAPPPPDAAAPDAGPGAQPVGVDELIDAIDAQGEERTERYCGCRGNAQQCNRASFEGESCEQRALAVLSTASEPGVLELLNCWLPAEQAYTECVDRELNCRDARDSLRACTAAYEVATARCNVLSIEGLSLQQLCSR